jgi:uncharacterized membrane protein
MEVERLWRERPDSKEVEEAHVSFDDAPGDRGTEVRVDLDRDARGGKLGDIVQKVTGAEPLAKAKDELRRFKQLIETGEVARSDSTPEGESVGRKLKQRPAQPLEASEADKAGTR